jgi:two-component system, NarL family, nitrate/nitrite response regulator NarL
MTAAPAPVRVFLADDHPLYREALAEHIGAHPRLELVGEADNGRDAHLRILDLAVDVAVLDVRLPLVDGPGVARRLQRAEAKTRVLFLSAFDEGPLVYAALAAGAAGYLRKTESGARICEAILNVHAGRQVLAPEVSGRLIEEINERGRREGPFLSERETEILRMISQGHSSPAIAGRLHLSPATVKTHVHNLYGKLGVSDRGAAVAEAMRRGLLD